MQLLHFSCEPAGLLLAVRRVVAQNAFAGRQHRPQLFFDPVLILFDQTVADREDLRGRAVVLHHQDGLRRGVDLVEIQQKPHIRPAPGIDRLIRVTDDEEVFVVIAEDLHELILRRVDVLEFVDHDVFQTLLPFEADILMRAENVQGKFDQVVVVEREALLFLIQIAVEDDILRAFGFVVFLFEGIERQGDHVLVIVRPLLELQHLDHVARMGEGHVAQRQPTLVVDDLEHGVDVAVVEHQKALGIAHSVAVLLQDGDTEAVEGVDIAGVVVAGQVVDALAHLVRGLVGKGHAQQVSRQNAELRHQIREPARQRPRLAGARARDHAHEALGRRDRLPLRRVQPFEQIHIRTSCPSALGMRTKFLKYRIISAPGCQCAVPGAAHSDFFLHFYAPAGMMNV